jgi:hypothetical protein
MPTRTRNRMRSAPPGVLPLKEVVVRSRVSITSQQTAPARWYARVGASQLARLSKNQGRFVHATRSPLGFDALGPIDERSIGNHRPRSKARIALRCSAVSSGASKTVARRPRPCVRTCTIVASIPASVCIMLRADFPLPSARRARLTSVKPITVAKVCNRKEPSAH